MKQSLTKLIPAVSATAVVIGMCPIDVFASETLSKEEVVYVNLAQDGQVEQIYVVNAFNANEGADLIDYGDYTRIQNLSTTAPLKLTQDKISLDEIKGRFYYQGDLESTDIPWLIQIKYYVDNKEINPSELAGISGHVDIKLSVTQNEKVDPVFYDHFALQVTFLFDSQTTSNIEADGATIANVGDEKQLVFNLLASGDKDIHIELDSTNFSMQGVQINGIPLTLKIDEPDTSEFKNQVTELQDGVVKLDDGASELVDGTKTLQDGASSLNEGASTLKQGSLDLRSGMFSLADGTQRIYAGVYTLKDGVSALQNGAVVINEGFNTLVGKSSSLTDGSQQVLNGLLQLDDGGVALKTGVDELVNQLGPVAGQLEELESGVSQVESGLSSLATKADNLVGSSNEVASYLNQGSQSLQALVASTNSEQTQALISALSQNEDPVVQAFLQTYVAQQNALTEISSGFTQLNTQYGTFNEGVLQYANGVKASYDGYVEVAGGVRGMMTAFGILSSDQGAVITLKQGVHTLSDGISELHLEYNELNNGVMAYTEGVATLNSGFSSLSSGINELAGGTQSLYSGSSALVDGTNQLVNGTESLTKGTTDLYNGTGDLLDGSYQLVDGTQTLSDGTTEMRTKTSNLDQEVDDQIDEMINSVIGDKFEMKSFTSDKNTEVNAVQFVMKTDAIKVEESKETPVKEVVELNFFEKLLKLFGYENN